ncbi:MAG: hypothetical protein ACRDZ1_01230, partial [Acidimicrobiia bacterium]
MSDETMPEATTASETKAASEAPAPAGGADGIEARSGADGPKRRRRRGSRGGRNRRKRTAAARVAPPGGAEGTE